MTSFKSASAHTLRKAASVESQGTSPLAELRPAYKISASFADEVKFPLALSARGPCRSLPAEQTQSLLFAPERAQGCVARRLNNGGAYADAGHVARVLKAQDPARLGDLLVWAEDPRDFSPDSPDSDSD